MKRMTANVVLAALLLLPMASSARRLATGAITLEPGAPLMEIDFRIRLDGLDSAWSGRIALEPPNRRRTPSLFPGSLGERFGGPDELRAETDGIRQWFLAVRAIGRFAVRRLVHLTGIPFAG